MGNVIVSATDSFTTADVVIGGNPGAFPVPPKFPLSLVSTKDLLNWSNAFPSDAVPTLSADISASDTSISLTAGTGSKFPAETFEVSIDDEIIYVAVRSGDTLLGCVRGAENSTPAGHFTGATAQQLVTAVSHNQVSVEIVEIEQLLGANGYHIFPVEISLAPSLGGNFTVAHGLGVKPRFVLLQMTSDGSIWFQTARYDETNIYLVASAGGITGVAEVWV